MKYLIDTHILLWFIDGNAGLSPGFISEIENPENNLFISIASLWEIAIKINIGKLVLSSDFELLEQYLIDNNIVIIDIDFETLSTLIKLPLHHQDPFDRLIISQAETHKMTIITNDNKFQYYDISLLQKIN